MVQTEKEFSQIFAGSCKCEGDHKAFVDGLAAHYWTDLTAHLNRYFSNEDRLLITQKAANELALHLKQNRPHDAWKNVIRDFTASGYWGFLSISEKPAQKKTEDQKIFWKFFKYAWALFQAMVLVKIAILFVGLRAAQNPNGRNQLWVWIVCALALGSLGFFAYRNRNEGD